MALVTALLNVYPLQILLIALKGLRMKTLLSFFLLALVSVHCLAESLIVGAGQKMTITAAQQSLTLDRLVMEDNSTIDFAPDVRRWEVFAREASFGNNTTINGHGQDGSHGQDGKANTGDCKNVDSKDLAATDGQAGHDGVGIEMRLGIIHFKSLQIDVGGGNGGKGGNGGSVQGTGCKGIAGGNGGNAGAGGNGGHVLIAYWSASQDGYIPISNYGTGIQITISGGKQSTPGQGGKGVEGAVSKEIKRGNKGQTFGYQTAEPGKPGMPGKQASAGSEGTFLVRPVTNAEMAKQVVYAPKQK